MTTMNAILTTGYGSADVLKYGIAEKPGTTKDEILIKIHATSVTNAHTAIRTGYPLIGRLFMGLFKPSNPISGTDFAGEIVATGNNVRKFKVGERVFGSTDIEGGTYAEYVTVSQHGVVLPMPENLNYAEATAIIDGATTAYPFLTKHTQIKKGSKVLINGASGSIGTAAIQLAKHFGAEVTGVCSTSNVDMVKTLGADYVIDYTKEDFTQGEKKYDIIFDTVGKSHFNDAQKVLTEQGTYMSPVLGLRMTFDMLRTSRSKRKKAIFAATGLMAEKAKLENFRVIRDLLEQEVISPVIDRMYQLPQIVEAHRYVEKGHKKGNVVINVTGEAND
ncbi:MAG: NAD(P)-dependent alcohol dehydrogenase [Balneola sp.]